VIRHWSLMRILYVPLRLPFNSSSRVASENGQLVRVGDPIELAELATRDALDVRRQLPASLAAPNALCFSVGEAADHDLLPRSSE